MKPRFTTGELARLNGITKQTLIFYDRAGVFSPNEKDPHNGYRYYGADQLEMLDHILILKDMGLSLQEIRAFLSLPGPSDALDVLRRQREELVARQRRLSAALTRLNVKIDELEKRSSEAPGEVRFETLPEGWIAAHPVAPPGGTLETDIALKTLLRLAHDRQLPYLYQMGTRVSRKAMAAERTGPSGRAHAVCGRRDCTRDACTQVPTARPAPPIAACCMPLRSGAFIRWMPPMKPVCWTA